MSDASIPHPPSDAVQSTYGHHTLGIDELERGEYDEWDDVKDLAETIKKEGRALLKSSRPAKA
jgi:hypothetical protein